MAFVAQDAGVHLLDGVPLGVGVTGVSVILITHRLQDLFVVCDRIMVMYEGRNVAERLIGETGIEDIVNLIVGRKFRSLSA